MYLRCLSLIFIAVLPSVAAEQRILRVCADPNNMPFSNDRREGFENRLAEMIAGKLSAKLEYTWWSERKSFVRNSLDQGRCDVVMGVPATLESITATNPYYRSTYVFVSRQDRKLDITSLDDPRLKNWRIGIHVVGDDYAPPAYALARRGITSNIASLLSQWFVT
jgi:mxaJ protein